MEGALRSGYRCATEIAGGDRACGRADHRAQLRVYQRGSASETAYRPGTCLRRGTMTAFNNVGPVTLLQPGESAYWWYNRITEPTSGLSSLLLT